MLCKLVVVFDGCIVIIVIGKVVVLMMCVVFD